MKKEFLNFNDIEIELRRLDLERQIAMEEFKSVKGDLKESLQPTEWMRTGAKIAGKLGSIVLLKKIFRK